MPIVWALVGYAAAVIVNLVADRWPRDLPLSGPRCTKCDTPRQGMRWLALVALVSGQRRCPQCETPLPARLLVVEVGLPLVFAILAVWIAGLQLLAIISFHSVVLVLISVIDLETRYILNRIIYPAIVAAAALAFVTPNLSPASALAGGFVGFLLTGLIYLGGLLFVKVQARRGILIDEVAFGRGDVTLMLYLGFATGFAGVLRVLLYGVLLGGAAAILILVVSMSRRESALHVPFAYGPYLSLAGLIVLLQHAL